MISQRSFWKQVSKWVFGILFVLAGANHFRSPDMYMKIMPPYLPFHRPLVLISGVFEMVLGALLLVPSVSWLAAWGLIACSSPSSLRISTSTSIRRSSLALRSFTCCDCRCKAC